MSVERYNARMAEIHWQQAWDARKAFAISAGDPRPTCDVAALCPPSGPLRTNLVRHGTMLDVLARYKRARGFNVLPPAGGAGSAAAAGALGSMGFSLRWDGEAACGAAQDRRRQAPGDEDAFEAGLADIIETYGADPVRWFLLSDTPPDRKMNWTDSRIHGAWRFVHRLWRLINAAEKFSAAASSRAAAFSPSAQNLRRTAHHALSRISADIERLRFNICVAHVHTFARTLEAVVADSSEPASPDLKFAAREAAEMLVQLFYPMMPHLAEACWVALGREGLLATGSWPALEADLLAQNAVTLAVHVNGRRRADVTVARDARNGDIEASVLALGVIRQALDGKSPRKVIIVPQRIINVVA